MRKLIALSLLVFSTKVAALTCFIPTVEDRFRKESYVLLVEVVGARIEQSQSYSSDIPGTDPMAGVVVTGERMRAEPIWRSIVASVHVLESYKGENPPTELTLHAWGHRPEITVGAMYLVFTSGPDVSLDCDGMPLISNNEQHAKLLEKLRTLAK